MSKTAGLPLIVTIRIANSGDVATRHVPDFPQGGVEKP